MAMTCDNPGDCGNNILFTPRISSNGGILGIPDLDVLDIKPCDQAILVQTPQFIHQITHTVPHKLLATVDLNDGGALNCKALAVSGDNTYSATVCVDT